MGALYHMLCVMIVSKLLQLDKNRINTTIRNIYPDGAGRETGGDRAVPARSPVYSRQSLTTFRAQKSDFSISRPMKTLTISMNCTQRYIGIISQSVNRVRIKASRTVTVQV